MTPSEKIFSLKGILPFNRLRDSELILIAEITKYRSYAPGEKITSAGRILPKLYITIDGELTAEGPENGEKFPVPQVFGVESLLMDHPIIHSLSASEPGGANCLLINKGHFFTIMYECPELVIGFAETINYSPRIFFQILE
ncbi:MAG: hypothetical protein B6244_02805 [Candidatus Cloacimonetes bacterium 4572_55]|nr:MAG: hypothetical protein B6244_02805 [Candidatus Cloacimonetes bacterium 4572_55]